MDAVVKRLLRPLEPAALTCAELEDVQLLIHAIKTGMAEEKLLQAATATQELKLALAFHGEKGCCDIEHPTTVSVEQSALLEEVEDEYAHLMALLDACSSPDWKLAKENRGITTHWSTMGDEQPIVGIRVTGVIDCNLLAVMAVFRENELWSKWFSSRLSHSETVEDLSRFCRAVYVRAKGLALISARDCLIVGRGFDLLQEAGAAVILVRDARPDETPPRPSVHPSDVRMSITMGGSLLIPDGPERTLVVLSGCVNPSLAVIPSSLINFVVKHFADTGFQLLVERCTDPKAQKEYAQLMQEAPHVYAEIAARLAKLHELSTGV